MPALRQAIRSLSTFAGTWAAKIARDAERLESRPASFGKPRSEVENRLAIKWKELDKALDGALSEQHARAAAREAGGMSLGETDAAVRKSLGLDPDARAPDIGRDLGGGTLLLVESKGADIGSALGQLENGVTSPFGAGKTLVCQINLPYDVFDTMRTTSEVGGYAVTRYGSNWFLANPGLGGPAVEIVSR